MTPDQIRDYARAVAKHGGQTPDIDPEEVRRACDEQEKWDRCEPLTYGKATRAVLTEAAREYLRLREQPAPGVQAQIDAAGTKAAMKDRAFTDAEWATRYGAMCRERDRALTERAALCEKHLADENWHDLKDCLACAVEELEGSILTRDAEADAAVARERERITELVEIKRAKFNIGTRASLALSDVLDQIRARSGAKGE